MTRPHLTPAQQKAAYRLWKAYKTTTTAYRQIATAAGVSTADLNYAMSHLRAARENFPRAK